MYDGAQKIGRGVCFLGLTPVDEEKTSPIPWAPELALKNDLIKRFNDIVRNVCKEKNIQFIDTLSDWLSKDYKAWLDDGDHPNAEGHEKIFELVKKQLNI